MIATRTEIQNSNRSKIFGQMYENDWFMKCVLRGIPVHVLWGIHIRVLQRIPAAIQKQRQHYFNL